MDQKRKEFDLITNTSMRTAENGNPDAGKATGQDRSSEVLATVLNTLSDAKAEKVVSIDLRGKTLIGDYMVIASGRSQRHVGAIAEQICEKLKKAGHRDLKVEGMQVCDWVLIDTGDVIVHIFRPEVREFYNLEKIWSAERPTDPIAV